MFKTSLRNYNKEKSTINIRIWISIFFAFMFLLVLIIRFFYLQVIIYNKMAMKSYDNRVITKKIIPQRGEIYDNNGLLIAENKPSFNLTIVPENTQNISLTLETIKKLIGLSDREISRFYQQLKQRKAFQDITLKHKLTDKEIALIMANKFRLEGIDVTTEMLRFYPYRELTAHTVGYVGKINQQDIARLNNIAYKNIQTTGKTGIEKYYEKSLLGSLGEQQVEVNAEGRIINILSKTDAIAGKNINLFLDIKLQQEAVKEFADKRGALVAMDLKTGGIISMVSNPSFDPNLFVTGIDFQTYDYLNTNTKKPLFNRATLGEYPPASTIKPIMALALLAYDVVDPHKKIYDIGEFKFSDSSHKFRNWKRNGHGWVDICKSIIVSNDTFFYTFANELGINRIHDFAQKFNFGSLINFDLGEQRSGLLPSKSWKQKIYNKSWYPGETIISIIGQGYMLVTPMQLLVATAIIATRGVYIQPRMVKDQDIGISSTKEKVVFLADNPQKNKYYWDVIISAMKQSVHKTYGTAHRQAGRNLNYTMAGKTGTAQVIGIGQNEKYKEDDTLEYNKDHSLFIAFAPVEDPKIAVVAVVENSSGAVKIVRKIIDKYLSQN